MGADGRIGWVCFDHVFGDTRKIGGPLMNGPAKHIQTAAILFGIVAGMIGLAFASVPLYRLFCQVTGYEGTTQKALAAPDANSISDREITVGFSATIGGNLPWKFYPETPRIKVKVGAVNTISYYAENLSNRVITGHASFNVSPDLFGAYFSKIECFCFREQTLQPGEKIKMPVTFFLDPDMLKDKNLDRMTEVTLAYTMFESAVNNQNQPVN